MLTDVRKASESIVLFLLLANLELFVLRKTLQGLFCGVFGGDERRRDSFVQNVVPIDRGKEGMVFDLHCSLWTASETLVDVSCQQSFDEICGHGTDVGIVDHEIR